MALLFDKELSGRFATILTTIRLAAMPESALSCRLHHKATTGPLYIPLVTRSIDGALDVPM